MDIQKCSNARGGAEIKTVALARETRGTRPLVLKDKFDAHPVHLHKQYLEGCRMYFRQLQVAT